MANLWLRVPWLSAVAIKLFWQNIWFIRKLSCRKDEQIKGDAGFSFDQPNKRTPVSLKSYAFVDIAKFEYPQSWILYSRVLQRSERMEASKINIKVLLINLKQWIRCN